VLICGRARQFRHRIEIFVDEWPGRWPFSPNLGGRDVSSTLRTHVRGDPFHGAQVIVDAARLPEDATAGPSGVSVKLLGTPEPNLVAVDPLKRVFDVLASGVGLLLFLPLLLVVMALIKAESPGPAIFRQRRTGYRGLVFTIYKFRTMTVTEDCAAVRHAIKGDARVTAIGGLLRKLSIDELPQLWNVLKGDMSIVGPRPHALAHDEYYGALIPAYAARFRAKPGLTGYAQVNGFRGEIRDIRGMSDRVAADNSYIEAWSAALDLAILCRTVPLIFKDPRAY